MRDSSEVVRKDFSVTYPRFGLPAERGGAARHHFIFLDGTWNEERDVRGASTPTNVLRLFQELDLTGNADLITAHYYRGVGSRQDNHAADRFWFGFNGKDEERIRHAAFADLFRGYRHADDSIYIVGFSRGAASARLLAWDICARGLPQELEVHTTHFSNLLTRQIEPRVDGITTLNKSDDEKPCLPTIAFLGCWDTVDAFVLPSRFPRKENWSDKVREGAVRLLKYAGPRLFGKQRFTDEEGQIPAGVGQAVHCVAIDETRDAFLPTLMPFADNVEEVWFPGVHADVGGGYDDNLLAEAPYLFMRSRLEQAVKARVPKLRLFKQERSTTKAPGYAFHFHGLDSGSMAPKRFFGFGSSMRSLRVMDGPETARPKIHGSFKAIRNSDCVFASDRKNKRTWLITYDPYNVRELDDKLTFVDDGELTEDPVEPPGQAPRRPFGLRL